MADAVACFVCLRRFRQFLKSGGEHIEEGRPQRTKSVKNAISAVEARYLEDAAKSAGSWTDEYFNFDTFEEHHIGELDPQNAKTYHPKKDFARTRGPRERFLVVLGRGRPPLLLCGGLPILAAVRLLGGTPVFRPRHPEDEERERELEEKKRKLEEEKRKRKGGGEEPAAKRRKATGGTKRPAPAPPRGQKQMRAKVLRQLVQKQRREKEQLQGGGTTGAAAAQTRKREQEKQLLRDCHNRDGTACYMAATVQLLRAGPEFSAFWDAQKLSWSKLLNERRAYFPKVWVPPERKKGGKWEYRQECASEFMTKFFNLKGFPAQGLLGVDLGKRVECSVCTERWLAGAAAPAPVLDLPVPDEPDGQLSVQGLLDAFFAEERMEVPSLPLEKQRRFSLAEGALSPWISTGLLISGGSSFPWNSMQPGNYPAWLSVAWLGGPRRQRRRIAPGAAP